MQYCQIVLKKKVSKDFFKKKNIVYHNPSNVTAYHFFLEKIFIKQNKTKTEPLL